ncbi:unnamed protein product [Pleuronectes platessa]|uniref:Uncharacterized protein n=1 Tax=Pleuronectes platessa TaxID=8262 RepID=A0A9N7UI00_PLEPL|nr:unnamed protein product [Pleuronectes platessa]
MASDVVGFTNPSSIKLQRPDNSNKDPNRCATQPQQQPRHPFLVRCPILFSTTTGTTNRYHYHRHCPQGSNIDTSSCSPRRNLYARQALEHYKPASQPVVRASYFLKLGVPALILFLLSDKRCRPH